MQKGVLIRVGISAFLFLLFFLRLTGYFGYTLLDEMESFSYDTRLRLTMPGTVDKRIVIVDLDEKSLAAEGWPWPRTKYADLVHQLFDHYKIGVLGFDEVFGEPDNSNGGPVLDALASGPLADLPGFVERVPGLRDQLDHDRIFAAALAGKPVVMGVFMKGSLPRGEAAGTGELCTPVISAAQLRLMEVKFTHVVGYGGNIQPLASVAPICGFFDNPGVDEDGLFRHVPLLQEYNGQVYPSLALAVTQLALGNAQVSLEFDPPDVHTSMHLERVDVGKLSAPVDGQVAAFVPYRGSQYSFPYVSATDVLHGNADPEVMRGAIVLVGTTAAGLLDFRSTPVSKIFPGVEVHANLISGILDGRIKQKAPYYNAIEATFLLLIAVLMAVLYPRLQPIPGGLLVVGIIMSMILIGFAAWHANFITPLGIPIVFTLLVFLAQLFYGFFFETRKQREISRLFGQYVPPDLVAEMAHNPTSFSMATDRRNMTVLFTDVRGFTTISEKYAGQPQELSELMNQFLSVLTEVVFRHRGTIDKYMGDAIMAFWGAPLEDPANALHALQAAVEMPQALRKLDALFKERGWPELHIGVGLSTGAMSVGNMGSQFRVAYTVISDVVNLGSRLEGLTKHYGVEVICSDATRQAAPDWVYRELDLVRVKGKNEPVTIWEPIGPKDQVDEALRQDLSRQRQAMRHFRAQRWDEAEREFFGLSRSGRPHPIYERYLRAITNFRLHPPPPDWDGATNFETK